MFYQIGDFSRISRLSIKTLRFYHECGLLEPNHIDNVSGYRYYDGKSLERVKIITELKDLDFSLKEIREILDKCGDDSELLEYMSHKYLEIDWKIARYQNMRKKLEAFVKQTAYAKEISAAYTSSVPAIRNLDVTFVAFERFTGQYQDITPRFKKLFRYCGRHCAGPPMAIYYDNEYKEDDADIEVCVPVNAPLETPEINIRMLKVGKALTYLHYGPYEILGESYKALLDYQYHNGIKIQGHCREVYLKGPGVILPRSPKRFVTEIQMMIDPDYIS